MALELSILTLNVWGIPYISKDRELRIHAIGDRIAEGDYDVVSLQEVWSESDYQVLKHKLHETLPHTHYFYSGVVGSGLCVFSKFPIQHVFFHAWLVNGIWFKIQHGDWMGGKGVGLVRLNVQGKTVNVYLAHLHAEYDRACDEYLAHRVIQAFDTAQFIENTRGEAALQVLAGDLNTEPGDLAYRVLVSTAKLVDSHVHKTSTAPEGTSECARNSYTSALAAKNLPDGKRIDFIMFRAGVNYDLQQVNYNQPFPSRIPAAKCSYSDHEAVSAGISLAASHKSHEKHEANKFYDDNREALREAIRICDESLQQLKSHRRSYSLLAIGVIVMLLNMIEMQAPYGLKTAYMMLKFAISGIIIFFIFMATIWNAMERHGILAGKLSMEIQLRLIDAPI